MGQLNYTKPITTVAWVEGLTHFRKLVSFSLKRSDPSSQSLLFGLSVDKFAARRKSSSRHFSRLSLCFCRQSNGFWLQSHVRSTQLLPVSHRRFDSVVRAPSSFPLCLSSGTHYWDSSQVPVPKCVAKLHEWGANRIDEEYVDRLGIPLGFLELAEYKIDRKRDGTE